MRLFWVAVVVMAGVIVFVSYERGDVSVNNDAPIVKDVDITGPHGGQALLDDIASGTPTPVR